MAIDDEIRKCLALRCSSRRTRTTDFTARAPTQWQPRTLRNPACPTEVFSDDSAWELVAAALRSGIDVEIVTLEHPPGKTGYVLIIDGHGTQKIYVKLQLLSSLVLGRSFHESS